MNKNYTTRQNNPSRFRKRVQFQKLASYQTPEGHWVEGKWQTFANTFAQIRTIRGNEFIQAGASLAEVTARINIRYRADILKEFDESDELRIVLNNRKFEVVYINNLEEKNIELEFIVRELR